MLVQLPGFSPSRLVALARSCVAEVGLDLSSFHVLTEAATGAYGITAIVAALAGAESVSAFAKSSRYGSLEEVRQWMSALANEAGVVRRLTVIDEIDANVVRKANIVTNSGFLRPLTKNFLYQLPIKSSIALMFEAWEFRDADVDLLACKQRQIPVVGVNERHPKLNIFAYLGPLCVFHLQRSGIAVLGSRIALISDNDFDKPILAGLLAAGALAELFTSASELRRSGWDAIVIALQPGETKRVERAALEHIARMGEPSTVLAQFYGDIDRNAAAALGMTVWPRQEPSPGHMAILLSDIGPESIVRLQTGGLRAVQQVLVGEPISSDGFAQPLF